MGKLPKKYYRYRSFNAMTLDSLCNDTLYFAHPSSFNDPLDCNPVLKCDSNLHDLRRMLTTLIKKRVHDEIVASLKKAKIKGDKASEHALKQADSAAAREIADIRYSATNPEYEMSVDEAESQILTQSIQREISMHYERGVCCFSTSYSSALLWSHYGDQHRGICIGYSVERKPKPVVQRVVYGGERAIKTSTILDALVNQNDEAKMVLDRDVLLRKSRDWSYEKEWRLVGNQGLQSSEMLLCEITFGLRCQDSVIHSIVNALNGRSNDVKYYQIYCVHGKYRLRRSLVNLDEINVHYPVTAMSGFEMFGDFDES